MVDHFQLCWIVWYLSAAIRILRSGFGCFAIVIEYPQAFVGVAAPRLTNVALKLFIGFCGDSSRDVFHGFVSAHKYRWFCAFNSF